MKNKDKSYKVRSFVIDKGILEKLQIEADKRDRTLNWIVNWILEIWVQNN